MDAVWSTEQEVLMVSLTRVSWTLVDFLFICWSVVYRKSLQVELFTPSYSYFLEGWLSFRDNVGGSSALLVLAEIS